MKIQKKGTIVLKILERLEELKSTEALLRSDFNDLDNPRQVTRGLNFLIKEKKLLKIGRGIYARAYVSKYSDIPLIAGNNSTDAVFRNALTRLNVYWLPGSAEEAYNTRETTQIPVHNIVRLKSRFRGKIGYANYYIKFEGGINAR